ncbi:catenin alpha-2-like isoform X2 [Asterias rubens]|uniref:catenin alpha-2-like isoform X2 n=1 Tax=Asterias rubens TaxID=7604 RepID=UPI001455D166|nr:catenin alpha-2-like isoform X2 [Asterias rubens]
MTTKGSPMGSLVFKWDPKNLEIRTYSVEKTLEPLVMQVTTLVKTQPSNRKKGHSKKAHVLVAAVAKATEAFIKKGEEIANEIPEIRKQMLETVADVREKGDTMHKASSEFADDPCSSMKRGSMTRAARNLLSAVTRLLIMADMVDVHLLLKSLQVVEGDLAKIMRSNNQQDLASSFKTFGKDMVEFNKLLARRQNDLKDPRQRDEMAAARADLKKHSTMLLTASQAYLRHPDVPAARENRDFVVKQLEGAMNTISNVSQAHLDDVPEADLGGTGELIAALDDLDRKIKMSPTDYNEIRTRPSLEEQLESIISGAALMADSSCTRDNRRERIVAECNAVRQALQDLLTEYMNCAGRKDRSDPLDQAIDRMCHKTRDLRRQLRKAVGDHVSDTFLETNMPLLVLIEAAKSGNERETEHYAGVFREHAQKLVEVAHLACSMSSNEEGVKMVRMAVGQIETLCPQVINAARTLAARPRSQVALENMDVFKDQWENQVKLLTEAVDDITTIDDFLAVSEGHILEDVNKAVMALQMADVETLDRTGGAIRGRAARICGVVDAEMQNYEPGVYTDKVKEAVLVLQDQVMPHFTEKVEKAVSSLNSNNPQDMDENEFIDASRMVYDGVRDVRRAVLMNRSLEDMETDTEYEEEEYDVKSRSSYKTEMTEDEDVAEGITSRAMMRDLPDVEKEKIHQEVELFRIEKEKLDMEMAKWDDTGNDIIILAKQMCMIMMEMTDFTRGRGPLKTTMHVINAAKKIAEAGSKLDKLARCIADLCPDSSSKNDLIAYLQRIALYCHQLNITSKVKAEIQNISGELVLSGLDSATSLIQAAKNLMAAVVLTVKASYVASTKYSRLVKGPDNVNSPVVSWKMKPPEKKPLVRREVPEETQVKIRKGAKKLHVNPVQELSIFKEKD